MPSKPMELIFPLKGVNDGWGFGNQPEGTTPGCLNVIPVDTLDSRIRGGQRWGTTKYFANLHNGANAIQRMTTIVEFVSVVDPVSESFTQANAVLDGTNWYPCTHSPYPSIAASGTIPQVVSNQIDFSGSVSAGTISAYGLHKTAVSVPGSITTLTMEVTFDILNDGTSDALDIGFVFRSPNGSTLPFAQNTVNRFFLKLASAADDVNTFSIHLDGFSNVNWAAVTAAGDRTDPAWWSSAKRTISATLLGNTFKFYIEGELVATNTSVVNAGQTGLGFYLSKSSGAGQVIQIDDFQVGVSTSSSGRAYKLIAVSDGDVYLGSPPETLTLATDGENVVATSGRVDMQTAFAKVYFCDGVNANYSVLDNATDTVSAWTPDSGTLPVSGTGGCKYIVLYRGRIVMAGLKDDPHNWFMSAVDNPLDWDYGATVSETMAVAGNQTDTGKCPDIITCLAPYSDDLMFIGGDHTLWLMRGDPASRGRIDNISYQTGISGPDAYTFDPNGMFYFFGQGILWRMSAEGVPEPLSLNRMDETFKAIDLTTNTIILTWDNIRRGLHMFVRPSASGATTHYYWDERTDSFWPISFPNVQGPTTALAFDGDDPNDNAVLLGGWDGYIRYVDSSVKNDDSTKISSHVLYPPIMAGGLLQNTRINGLTAIVDASADGVTLTAYAEDTPQGAIESATIRYSRVLPPGRTRVLNRVAGNAIMFKLSNVTVSETWAIENIIVDVEVTGRTRKHQL